jgi:hypothetical protein
MKNKNQLVLLLVLVAIALEASSQKENASSLPDSALAKDTFIKQTDTVTTSLNDTLHLIQTGKSSDLKIIVAKGEETTDNFKYIFPVLTLLLGIGVNKFLEYLSDKKKINKSGERWVAEIRCLEVPIRKQIEALKAFLVEHNQEKFDVPQLEIYPLLDGEVFKSLDKTELLKYIEHHKAKNYGDAVLASNKVQGFISILASHYEALKPKFDEYLKGTSAHTTSLSRNLQGLMKAFGQYGVDLEKELNGDPANDPRYKPLLDLFETHIVPYMSSGDYDVFQLEKDFFIPLIQLLGHLRQDRRIDDMTNFTSGCLNDIKGIKMEKHYFGKNVETIIGRYEKELIELPKIIAEIK